MKILFMGTPDFSRESLEKLYNSDKHEIIGVVTTPDRPAGRGMKLIASPVKEFAIEKKLKLFQPEKIANNEEFKEEIRTLNPDIVCVVSYGKILPKSFLKIPKFGCINVHPSLLPKYRGSAPIQWAIINGDKETGVTIMYLNEKMDEGDIILQEKTEILEDETTGQLWDRLSTIGARMLEEAVNKIENGTSERIPQGKDFSIAPMLDKNMSKIDWNKKTGIEIKNLVRGLNPIMGTYTFLEEKKIKFWKVDICSNEKIEEIQKNESMDKKEPGTILISDSKKGLYVKTLDGILEVLELQAENAKRMNVNDFLRGNIISVGAKFI